MTNSSSFHQKVFERVGYGGEASGRLVLGAQQLAYYCSIGDDKPLLALEWTVVASAKSDGKKLRIDTKGSDHDLCEFTMTSKTSARIAEDKITKLLLAKDDPTEPTTLTNKVPQLKPEPELVIAKVDSSDDTPSQQEEEKDLETARSMTRERNQDRLAKRKAAPKERATTAGAQPDPPKPRKHGLGRKKAPKASSSAEERLDRVAPPSLSTLESDAPFLAAAPHDNNNAFLDASQGSNTAMEEKPSGSDGGTSVEGNGDLVDEPQVVAADNHGYLVEATLVPEDSEQGFQDEEGGSNDDETPLVVEAYEAGLRDHLQSRKLQVCIVGMVCFFVIVTIILVVVFVVALPSSSSSEEPADAPSDPPSAVSTGPKTIVDLVGQSDDLTILAQLLLLLQDDNLLDDDDENRSYTLFAPNDDAFHKTEFNESSIGRALQEFSLGQHVVPGMIPFQLLRGNAFLTLEEGVLLTLNDNVQVLSDLVATNGMVYIIDTVFRGNSTTEDLALDMCKEEFSRDSILNSWDDPTNIDHFESNTAYINPSELNPDCQPNTAWALTQEFRDIQGEWFKGHTAESSTTCINNSSSYVEHLIQLTMPADGTQFDLFVAACQAVPKSPTLTSYEGPRLTNGYFQQLVPRRNITSGEEMPFSAGQLQPMSDEDTTYSSVVVNEGYQVLLHQCYTTKSGSNLPTLNVTQAGRTKQVLVKGGFEFWVGVYSSRESGRAMVPFSQCLERMNAADTNEDSFLSPDEYVSFVNQLAATTNYSTFESLPLEVQAAFTASATSNDKINIAGAAPSQRPNVVQLTWLEQVCTDTEISLSTQGGSIAGPSTPTSFGLFEAETPPPNAGQITIPNSFYITNSVGITANDMNNLENPNRQRFADVYALFIPSLVETHQFTTQFPFLMQFGTEEYAAGSAQLLGFEDIECPPEVPQEVAEVTKCLLVYAQYVVDQVSAEMHEELSSYYTSLTQDSMTDGDPNLKDYNAKQDPTTQIDILAATEDVQYSNRPTPAPTCAVVTVEQWTLQMFGHPTEKTT